MFARIAAAALLLASCAAPVTPPAQSAPSIAHWAEACEDWAEWDKPGPPFQVHGNTYYVGTCGISAILVTGDEGHVLIDGGTESGAELIARNIEALGFGLADVEILLMSHEHHDHVGGTARLQQMTGARLLASPEAAPVMRSGLAGEDDPQFGMNEAFPAARVDGEIASGKPVRFGNLTLVPIATPGHTTGALTWQWNACTPDDDCRTVVYADSLTPISNDSYRFSDHPGYLADYRHGLFLLSSLACDILLTPHPSASGMRERSVAGDLRQEGACPAYADAIRARLDERLAKERDGG
jgi:metallo-beta-lactamase class B